MDSKPARRVLAAGGIGGYFALKSLKLSRDRKKLAVQFFWQVPGNSTKLKAGLIYLQNPHHQQAWISSQTDTFGIALRMVAQLRAFIPERRLLPSPRTPKPYRYQAWNS
jgi:hypothetical protein